MRNYNLNYFINGDWSFAAIKDKKIIFKSKSQGLKPLVFCLKNYKKEMAGAIVFDKIIGRAGAMLLAYGKVEEIWTPIISEGGLECLRKNKIKIIYKKRVESIQNKKGDDLCPMEKMAETKNIFEIMKFFKI